MTIEIRESRSLLCRLGLHKWSDHRGGIQICRRSGCHGARTFGLTGTMRRMRWEESLHKTYKRFEEGEGYMTDESSGQHSGVTVAPGVTIRVEDADGSAQSLCVDSDGTMFVEETGQRVDVSLSEDVREEIREELDGPAGRSFIAARGDG